jgi:transposase
MKELMTMSCKEERRLNILRKVEDKQFTQKRAAQLLSISDRQVRNLLHSLKESGAEGIISKKRGRMRNRVFPAAIKQAVLKLVQEHYSDFSPTFACEKLEEYHDIRISKETLRKWMIEIHLWIPKLKRRKLYLLRSRKEAWGEMLQGDGSHHDWFESGQRCTLLYFIDDATSRITAARFEATETLMGYFHILKEHLCKWGIPLSIYTDRFAVFETSSHKDNLTQFRRALETLGIQWIGANSAQAKGRIERANRTLQDRLVKEMRIQGIKTLEEGNQFLAKFIEEYNTKFSKKPMKSVDLHRPLDGKLDLNRTLSRYEERTLTKDLTFQFHNTHYKILQPARYNRGKQIEVRIDGKGGIRAFDDDIELLVKNVYEVEEYKKVIPIWPVKNVSKPKSTHPWKEQSYHSWLREREKNNQCLI